MALKYKPMPFDRIEKTRRLRSGKRGALPLRPCFTGGGRAHFLRRIPGAGDQCQKGPSDERSSKNSLSIFCSVGRNRCLQTFSAATTYIENLLYLDWIESNRKLSSALIGVYELYLCPRMITTLCPFSFIIKGL